RLNLSSSRDERPPVLSGYSSFTMRCTNGEYQSVSTQAVVSALTQTMRIAANVPAGTVTVSRPSAAHRRSTLSVSCSSGLLSTYFMLQDWPTAHAQAQH